MDYRGDFSRAGRHKLRQDRLMFGSKERQDKARH